MSATQPSPNPPEPEDPETVRRVTCVEVDVPPRSMRERAGAVVSTVAQSPTARWVGGVTAILGAVGTLVAVLQPMAASYWAHSKTTDKAEERLVKLEESNAELLRRLDRLRDEQRALRHQTGQRLQWLEGGLCEVKISRLYGYCGLEWYPTPADPSLPRTAKVQLDEWRAIE